jgi:chromosome partitioning protein
MIFALSNRKSDVGETTLALDPVVRWTRQRFWVGVLDADRKGENENCCLDWFKQRAKEGLTRRFLVIGVDPGAPRLEALEIAWIVGHVVTHGPPRFTVRTHSVLLVSDVALTPFQPSPSGEGEPVEIRKLLKKARIFRPDIHPGFILNRYGPRALTAREWAKARATQDPPTPCARVGRHTAFAHAASSGQLLSGSDEDGHAARADDRTRCRNHERRAVTAYHRRSAFAVSQRDPQVRSRNSEHRAVESVAKTQRFTARLPIDVTPELRSRFKVTAFQRRQMVAEMPRKQIAREFPKTQGDGADVRTHRG